MLATRMLSLGDIAPNVQSCAVPAPGRQGASPQVIPGLSRSLGWT